MAFRDRLVASLRSMQPVLDVDGVMVAGSQVPNLLEPSAASTLVVSLDVDLVVPISRHREVKEALKRVHDYWPSREEPSVWVPKDPDELEVNFIGSDPTIRETSDSYVLEDDRLPLLVFGLLSHLSEGTLQDLGGVRVRVPRPAGLLLEKLLTERGGVKGERDLLVALGLLLVSAEEDIAELARLFGNLAMESRRAILSNLTILSLMKPIPEMPDPTRARGNIAGLLRRLEAVEPT